MTSSNQRTYSTVTAILPTTRSGAVVNEIISNRGASALLWRARGTLLQDHWWQRWVPPISPAKTMLQMLVPDEHVPTVIDHVVSEGNLHQQATGAVFSMPCNNVYFGSQYHQWPESLRNTGQENVVTQQDMGAIYCIVSQSRSRKICDAAINAGAHGPIVHYCEGRGLRDRLGWLRITKEQNQEVLVILAKRQHIENVFDAVAQAGEFHRPGQGLMYRVDIENGMMNLPSRVSARHYDANMQQIIRAIDHLSGHSHWRDNGIGSTPAAKKSARGQKGSGRRIYLNDQVRVSAIVAHSEAQAFSDMVLEAGVPGLTVVQTFFSAAEEGCQIAGARVNEEYALYRCILKPSDADKIRNVVESSADERGIKDLCVYTNDVPCVARYIAGAKDYRTQPGSFLPSADQPMTSEA